MIPTWWQFTILTLACFRLTRLAGWDDFPLAVKARDWVTDTYWVYSEDPTTALPGKQPTSEAAKVRPATGRPKLSHMIHCPFCIGWWISLAAYGVWLAAPTAAIYFAVPWALSGVVGVIAKNLDA